MEYPSKAQRLRIYISSTDKDGHQPLYESIIFQARDAGLAGATATKGIMGFGESTVIHSLKFWELADKVPLVVEIIDEKEKIETFLDTLRPLLETMHYGCLVTQEEVNIRLKKAGKPRS
jgi:hypothetical protein